jgi:shikimate kinase
LEKRESSNGINFDRDSTVEEGEENLIVDVVSGEHPPSTGGGMVPYDRQRALMAMNEVVRFMLYIHGPVELETTPGKEGKIEEDPLTKTYARYALICGKKWTSQQLVS